MRLSEVELIDLELIAGLLRPPSRGYLLHELRALFVIVLGLLVSGVGSRRFPILPFLRILRGTGNILSNRLWRRLSDLGRRGRCWRGRGSLERMLRHRLWHIDGTTRSRTTRLRTRLV